MEFLTLCILAMPIYIVLFCPKKEGLAFASFVAGSLLCWVMFFLASWTSLLPFIAY